MAAAHRTPTTFAVATLRSRNRPSGTSGERHPSLDDEEDRQQHRRGGEQPDRLARRPAGLVAVHDRVDGEHQRGRHGDRAGDVETPRDGRPALGRQQPQGEGEDGDPDRDVDEEDPVPVEDVGQDAAEQDADASSAGQDEAEHAHRLRPLAGLGEQVHDQRQRDRRDDRAAEPLHRPRPDEQPLRVGEAARERGQREERDADQEQPAVTEESPSLPPSSRKPPKVSR